MAKIDKLLKQREALDAAIKAAAAREKRVSAIAKKIEALGLADLPAEFLDPALVDLAERLMPKGTVTAIKASA